MVQRVLIFITPAIKYPQFNLYAFIAG
jgi:hypothetical protein